MNGKIVLKADKKTLVVILQWLDLSEASYSMLDEGSGTTHSGYEALKGMNRWNICISNWALKAQFMGNLTIVCLCILVHFPVMTDSESLYFESFITYQEDLHFKSSNWQNSICTC